jgi:D-alanyl-D-alanine carboxypeptidase/D-alanyl-D-alanine-endopeptidase (penicillin-binding protein 4)
VVLALGALVVALLTAFPYTLTLAERAGRRVVNVAETTLAPAPDPNLASLIEPPPQPAFDVATWYGAREEEPERHGVLIESYDGREIFAAHNADTPFNPASLVKLATSLVALQRLGKDYRFETSVFVDGQVDAQKKVLLGDLYLAGDDPSFGDSTAALVARELKARGVERIEGKVLVTPRFSFNLCERADDSAKFAAQVMKLKQKETGVADESKGRRLFVVRSAPLRNILLYMNAHSVNFIAHRLGDLLGGPEGVAEAVRTQLNLPTEAVRLESTSGLYNNRMTPRTLVQVLHALTDEARRQSLKPEDILPVASCDAGTLRRRMDGTGYEGAVVGKTGTLTEQDGGMSNLGGVVYTRDEGPVLFVIIAQGQRIWDNKQMADQLLAEVLHEHPPAPVCTPGEQRRSLLPQSDLQAAD